MAKKQRGSRRAEKDKENVNIADSEDGEKSPRFLRPRSLSEKWPTEAKLERSGGEAKPPLKVKVVEEGERRGEEKESSIY